MKVSELLKQFESQQKSVAEQKIETIQENVAPIVSAPKPVKIVAKKQYIKKPKIVITPETDEQEKNIETTEIIKADAKLPEIDLSAIGTINNTATQKRKRYTVRNLVDVKAIEAEITAEIAFLDREIKRLSIEMGKQKMTLLNS